MEQKTLKKLAAAFAFAAAVAAAIGAVTALGSSASPPDPSFARVSANGTLRAGSPGVTVANVGPGQYEVTFPVNVSDCAYLSTTTKFFTQATQSFTAGGHNSVNGVFVETKNQGGGLQNAPFNLDVICGEVGTQFAVVGYDGGLVRSSGATLTQLGTGRYQVTFPANVSGCAYLATVGDPGNGLVLNPSGAYTARGSNGNSVLVETKNPGGGLQGGIPFHLGVVCPDTGNGQVAVVRSDTGRYVMVTNRSLVRCATVATRGSTQASVPFNPATVEVTGGPAFNTVGIEVRELLFFGGDLTNEAFHMVSVC
jgi:hypothetical protein